MDGFAVEAELGSERAGQGLPRRPVRPQARQRISGGDNCKVLVRNLQTSSVDLIRLT